MMTKRAILFVAFGGIRPEVRGPIEDWFVSEGADRWPDRWIEMVSGAEQLEETLIKLGSDDFREVTVQPLLINHGKEYEKVRGEVHRFVAETILPMKVRLGKPLLWDHRDMERLAQILGNNFEPTIYVAHGTGGSSDETFRIFERKFRDIEWNTTFVGTMKEAHGPKRIGEKLGAKSVTVKPLMLTAGAHAEKDLAGTGEHSWKTQLEAMGFEVHCEMTGLGEYPGVRAIFLDHAAEATLIRRNSNPLEALILAGRSVNDSRGTADLAPLTQTENSLGLDETKILACTDMRQALMIQELQNQELFPDCELELVEGDLAAVIAMIDGLGADDCGEAGCQSDYAGLICNYGELKFLGLEDRVRAIFTVEEIVPAIDSGSVNAIEAMAKQAFISELELSPESITSVYAEGDEDGLELWAIYYDESTGQWWTDWVEGDPAEPVLSGREFAINIRNGGQWDDVDWDEADLAETDDNWEE